MRKTGWFKESFRHGLAARGITTSRYHSRKYYQKGSASFKFTTEGNDPGTFNLGVGGFGDTKTDFEEPKAPKEKTPRAPRKTKNPVSDNDDIIPGSASKLRGVKDTEKLKEEFARLARSQRQAEKLAKDVSEGRRLDEAKDALSFNKQLLLPERLGGFSRSEKTKFKDVQRLIQESANKRALEIVQSGGEVPSDLKKLLSLSTRSRVNLLDTQQKRELEGSGKKLARQLGEDAALSLVDTPQTAVELLGEAGAGSLGAIGEGLSQPELSKDFPGILDEKTGIPAAGKTPFISTNVFVGNEEDGFLKTPDVPSIKSSLFDFGDSTQKTRVFAEKVNDQIDVLHRERDSMANIDLMGFKAGQRAFKAGNREDLLKSIVDLQAEEGKLKDRWHLVNIAHSNFLNTTNFESSLEKKSGNPVMDSFFGSGSNLVDQTRKLNDTKAVIKKANDEVFTRRKILEGNLQRLDQNVPPDVGAPDDPQRLNEGFDLSAMLSKNKVLNDNGTDE